MAGAPPGFTLTSAPLKGRADFSKSEFDSVVAGFGFNCVWEQAIICPCRNNSQTEQPDPLCSNCDGGGREYYNPKSIRAVFMQPEFEPDSLKTYGEWWGGKSVITVRAENPVGYLDRLTVKDVVIWYSEIIKRKAGETASLRYPVASRTMSYVHEKTGEARDITESIDRLSCMRGGKRVVLDKDVDFVVTGDGKIDFSKGDAMGTAPPVGAHFSAKYYINPVWVITSLKPHAIQNAWTATGVPKPTMLDLPASVTAQLDFMMGGD
jgi:hypothetical protein